MNKLILVIAILLAHLCSFAGGRLELTLKPLNTEGETEHNCWAFIYLNEDKIDMVAGDKINGMKFDLDFDKEYRLELNSKNYETIEIFVNTKGLSAANKKYVYEYSSSFDLIEKKPGMKAKYKKGSEAKLVIKYNVQKDNFTNTHKYNPVFEYVPIEEPKKEEPKPVKEEPKEEIKPEDPKKEEKTPIEEKPEITPAEPAKDSIPEDIPDTTKESKPEVVEEKKEPLTEEPEQKENPEPKKVKTMNPDHLVEQKEKEKAAKTLRSELEKERLQLEEDQMKNYYSKAKSKRTFLEELSDSKIELKQQERNYQP